MASKYGRKDFGEKRSPHVVTPEDALKEEDREIQYEVQLAVGAVGAGTHPDGCSCDSCEDNAADAERRGYPWSDRKK